MQNAKKKKKKALCWSLLTNTGLPGKRIGSIVMETASALTVVPPWEVNTAWMVVTLNDPLCTLINICLREKHKPARKLISFDTNALGFCFCFLKSSFNGSWFITVPNSRHFNMTDITTIKKNSTSWNLIQDICLHHALFKMQSKHTEILFVVLSVCFFVWLIVLNQICLHMQSIVEQVLDWKGTFSNIAALLTARPRIPWKEKTFSSGCVPRVQLWYFAALWHLTCSGHFANNN